eukprot:595345-Pelagomonas_calceolata.AAC.2
MKRAPGRTVCETYNVILRSQKKGACASLACLLQQRSAPNISLNGMNYAGEAEPPCSCITDGMDTSFAPSAHISKA